MKYAVFIPFIMICCTCFSQKPFTNKLPVNGNLLINVASPDTGQFIISTYTGSCKNYNTDGKFIPLPVKNKKDIPPAKQTKFLTIHGNVYYDYYQRSKIDTPVNQLNFQQHTERIYLDVTIKEKYPLKIYLSGRQSNSPYFKNFYDLNLQFDRYGFAKKMKEELMNKIVTQLPDSSVLQKLRNELNKELDQYTGLRTWLQSPATLQKLIEEKERLYNKKLTDRKDSLMDQRSGIDKTSTVDLFSLKHKSTNKWSKFEDSIESKKDSVGGRFAQLYKSKKEEADSIAHKITVFNKRVDSVQNVDRKNLETIKQKIYSARSEKELSKIAEEYGIKLSSKEKLEKKLSAIKTLSIGRASVNYTELTAQNIIITGLNIEYNPSWYAAFAVGKIDYRFRDFFNKQTQKNNQYLVLGRLGIGDKDRKALIFTLFQGRKNQSEYALADSVGNYVNIMGYSMEAIWKKDEYTSLSAEYAKSTRPVSGNLQQNKEVGSLWKFKDNTNNGFNIKAQTIIPETNTKLSGFYRKTGENFQSFSLFSYHSNQSAWQLRADQSLLKNKVTITGMLRQNDFVNPFTEKTFKTSTTFKSIQANIRYPKYPFISIGYYPGTQLYIIDKERISENAYYILNASAVYNYTCKGIHMSSSLVMNRYFNKATDSVFVLYKGINYYLSQTIFLNRLHLQGSYAYNEQPEFNFYTLEAFGDYSFKKIMKITAGVKHNKVNTGDMYWGGRAAISADFRQLGGLQFQYEKSYLPTINQTLYPIETGRVSLYKYF